MMEKICDDNKVMKDTKLKKPWWPTKHGFHAAALLCAPCRVVPAQYLCESLIAVQP